MGANSIKRTKARAPGVVKLFGEHAVVYGRLAIAAAISLFASAQIEDAGSDNLTIELSNFGTNYEFSKERLGALHASYKSRTSIKDYITKNSDIKPEVLPYATIASKAAGEYNANLIGKKATLTSEITAQRGLASSGSCCTAFAVAILHSSKIKLGDDEAIELAREGEKIVHNNEGAGKIDVPTSYYGGYSSYSGSLGAKKEEVSTDLSLLLIDTGPKISTAETVGKVAERFKNNKEGTEAIFDRINSCAIGGIGALKAGNINKVGSHMTEIHKLLAELGVSTERLDRAVTTAIAAGAYGAKLSGGGGGGLAVAIAPKDRLEYLVDSIASAGFTASVTQISQLGAKELYEAGSTF